MFDNCFFFNDFSNIKTKPFTMKTNLFWILFFLFLGYNFSFSQNPLWLLDNRYINSSVSTPSPQNLPKPTTIYGQVGTTNSGTATNPYPYDGYDGQKPKFAGNIQPKPDGTIDFFIMDGVIYDGQGNFIDELFGENSLYAKGTSEIMIVPYPGQCNKYFIFSATINFYPGTLIPAFKKSPFIFILYMNMTNINTNNINFFSWF